MKTRPTNNETTNEKTRPAAQGSPQRRGKVSSRAGRQGQSSGLVQGIARGLASFQLRGPNTNNLPKSARTNSRGQTTSQSRSSVSGGNVVMVFPPANAAATQQQAGPSQILTGQQNPNVITVGTIVGSVVTHVDKGKVMTKPSDYHVGQMVRIPYVNPSLDPSAKFGDDDIGWTANTGPISAKLRPAIIVGVHQNSMSCLPMFTSRGRGMHGLDHADSVWIRQYNDDSDNWKDVPESDYLMLSDDTLCEPASYINLTRPYSLSFHYPIEPLGKLTDLSRGRMEQMWIAWNQKGLQKLVDQEDYAAEQLAKIPVYDEFNLIQARLAQAREAATWTTVNRSRPRVASQSSKSQQKAGEQNTARQNVGRRNFGRQAVGKQQKRTWSP